MAWIIIHSLSEVNTNLLLGKGLSLYNQGDYTIGISKRIRFTHDQCLALTASHLIANDGILLNKRELLESTQTTTLHSYLELPQNSSKIDFNQPLASQFRGPFTGFVIHIKDGWCHAYANQTGDTSVFFIQNDKYSIISSDYNLLFNTCKDLNIHLTFNSLAAQQMLSLGYLVEDVTFAREINRLLPGQLLLFQPGQAFSFSNYHRFDNTNSLEISIDEAVEKLDLSFRHAVKRCFDKDLEYGYNHHLADLSGGLDSRMTTWVAKELGYKNITNLCYTKAGVKESQYAAWTATRLKNEFIFQQLDDLNFLHDNEEIVRLNHGFGFYAGITGGNRLLKSLNFDHFGLEHTGQIGDVIVGTFLSKATLSKTWNPQDICYSDQVKAPIAHTKEYPNDELSMLYYRAFQGALSTHFIRRKYTEVVSPFLDVDFITLCLSLPLEFRVGHKLYARWIELKYPEILEIPSTRALPGHTGGQKQKLQRLLHPSLKKGLVIMLRKLGVLEYARQYQAMNPFNLWYSQDTELRNYLDSYYEKELKSITHLPELQKIVSRSYLSSEVIHKLLAITVLSVNKVYFKDNSEI